MTSTYISTFLPYPEILRLPIHDYNCTPMKTIWQDYLNKLQQWEDENKETKYIYDTLALQIDIHSLPPPETIDGLVFPLIPQQKLQKAMIEHEKTMNIFK